MLRAIQDIIWENGFNLLHPYQTKQQQTWLGDITFTEVLKKQQNILLWGDKGRQKDRYKLYHLFLDLNMYLQNIY
jgi:hypothetical protein